MTTANIIIFVDLQKGFALYNLTPAQGGSLYVPNGENAGEKAARLIHNAKNTIFILSQDFHTQDHISFMTSHPGVMAMRMKQFRDKMPKAEAFAAALNPPFDDILLTRRDGVFRAIACGVGTKWCAVDTDERGYITAIRNEEIPTEEVLLALRQKLWSQHCTQGTESALFVDPVMSELPLGLTMALYKDLTSPVLSDMDNRGNTFYVVRKGFRRDLDSYGLATENDGKSKTKALEVFRDLAIELKRKDVKQVNTFIGGLATNFCVEFSDSDVHTEFYPLLEKLNIPYNGFLLTDISYGIPLEVPSGAWPDINNAENRMLVKGKKACTTEDVIRKTLAGRKFEARRPTADA